MHPDPRAAIVIAVLNEAETIPAVCAELLEKLAVLTPYEVVFVDDGSTDATVARLNAFRAAHPQMRLIRHDRRCGKSAALRTGIAAARAPWIATMDGDGQNDPGDLPRLLRAGWDAEAAGGPAPLVAGIRSTRIDTTSKRFGSRFANALRQAVLGDRCPDTGCGVKVFRRDDFLRLPGFEGMHRFLPALFQLYGHPLICLPVQDRARMGGHSKYTNWQRALVGLFDLLGVLWLRQRTHRPCRVTEDGTA